MTRQRSFKERIRARMEKTGESYTTARRHLIQNAGPKKSASRTPQTISPVRKSEESVRENTGRSWDEWFNLLDRWGAKDKKHPDIVRWLQEEQDVAGWWAQSVTVAYEQERGLRAPGQRADGTYSVSASKTINVPLKTSFEAFRDEGLRDDWLGAHDLEIRTARPGKSITATWEDGSTRLTVSFVDKGANKSQVALAHEKITDAGRADELKAFWRDRMTVLKELLEQ